MAAIAPMLETLGYDPNDNEPNYEKVSLKSSEQKCFRPSDNVPSRVKVEQKCFNQVKLC